MGISTKAIINYQVQVKVSSEEEGGRWKVEERADVLVVFVYKVEGIFLDLVFRLLMRAPLLCIVRHF